MKIKTSELTGTSLDFSVAKCEGWTNLRNNPHRFNNNLIMTDDRGDVEELNRLCYSSNWAQGGPIIERELIEITPIFHSAGWQCQDGRWLWQSCLLGSNNLDDNFESFGNSPLIAAMRCYVASKLGDEVEIPDELC